MDTILQALEAYADSGVYPMHMPGHKRNLAGLSDMLPWTLDITELPGFDNLQNPTGILASSAERASALWGSETAFFLVNGSTVGILAGIRACTHPGDRVLLARNCHQSVYHALELFSLTPVFLEPPVIKDFGICGSISAKAVARVLDTESEIRLAVITSPTYEGILSDIRGISDMLHERGVPLLADEAHGAHLGLSPGFPPGAVQSGADIVVHSLHKTLPSLTQTGILHLQGDLVPPEAVRRALNALQTSSPSYPLLASIDSCVAKLREPAGRALFGSWRSRLSGFSRSMTALTRLRVFHCGQAAAGDAVFAFDPGKLVISCKNTSLSGKRLAETLASAYGIQVEMAMGSYVLAMTSICDTDEGVRRLSDALLKIDRACVPVPDGSFSDVPLPPPRQALSIAAAACLPFETIPLDESVGRISQEYVWAYPPGIPFLAPGQEIGTEFIEAVRGLSAQGVTLNSTGHGMPGQIRVVRFPPK